MAMVYVPAGGNGDPASLHLHVKKNRARPQIAIYSDTGSLVQTEAERAASVHAWKTNLLKQKKASGVHIEDPMLFQRQFSESELRALRVPARKLLERSSSISRLLPPINTQLDAASSVQDSVIGAGMTATMQLELDLKRKIKVEASREGSFAAAMLLAAIDDGDNLASPTASLVGGASLSVIEDFLQPQQHPQEQAPPMTPFSLASPDIGPTPHIKSRTFEEVVAREEIDKNSRDLSPVEQSTRLRRYKMGLSPMQKVKNMLDDIVSRFPPGSNEDGRPTAPLEAATRYSFIQPGGGGGNSNSNTKRGKRHHVIRLDNAGSVAMPSKEVLLTADDVDEMSFGPPERGDMFVGGDLEQISGVISNDSLSLTRGSPTGSKDQDLTDPEMEGGLFQAAVWVPNGDGGDDDDATPLTLNGFRSTELAPPTPGEVHAKLRIEVGHRNRLERVKAVRAAQSSNTPTAPGAPMSEYEPLFSCSRCTLGAKLWCQGCKLAFCFTCWGLVDHHRAEDSVRAMASEPSAQAFLTAVTAEAGAGGEAEAAAEAGVLSRLREPVVYARAAPTTKKPGFGETRLAPAPLEFDEANHTHFAAERADPERIQFLLKKKVLRLAETSNRMQNLVRLRRSKDEKGKKLSELRIEKVRRRVDRHRQAELEQRLAKALEEESTLSDLAHMTVGQPTKVQRARERERNNSQSRSPSPGLPPNWRKERIKSPVERLLAEAEDIQRLFDDPVAGWGWSEMPAKAAKKGNFSELPFTPIKDLDWALPDHIRDIRAKTPSKLQAASRVEIQKVASLW